jgi:uncharacterized protein (UPF0332 family)
MVLKLSEEEIKQLIERAENRIEAAEYLFKGGFYEDSVSRAYYCMYFAATALLLTKNITVKTHKGLIAKFGLEFVNKGIVDKYYGRALRIAEEIREESDYSIARQISKEEAKLVIEDAKNFLERIKVVIKELN